MTGQPLTAADESYRHQDVSPLLTTAHIDPAWAERCWHLLNLGDGWVLGAGRATWPHGGRRTAVAGVNTGAVQYARRAQEAFAPGDDPDAPQVGPIRIEAVKPLQEVRLTLDGEGLDRVGLEHPEHRPGRDVNPVVLVTRVQPVSLDEVVLVAERQDLEYLRRLDVEDCERVILL